MKKIIALLFLLVGCTSQQNKITDAQQKEQILMMINQSIEDFNDNNIQQLEIKYHKDIPEKPSFIDTIQPIQSLNELKSLNDTDTVTNALYTGVYPLEKCDMVFKIYTIGDNFWLNGEVSFEIKQSEIVVNNPEYANIKQELDSLLSKSHQYFPYLFGVLQIDMNDSKDDFYRVTEPSIHSIDDIKALESQVFTDDFLQNFYTAAFDSEDPIFKMINNHLYCIESEAPIGNFLPYDTTRIINVIEEENQVLIDLVVQYEDDAYIEIERIILVKTENGYRFNNLY